MAFYVAFYSFKGGVGRTLALANVAYSLAERGKRVVLLDLDLEAPGLRQFKEFRLRRDRRGFLDYADSYSRSGQCDAIEGFLHKCEVSFDEGELWLMPSGKRDAGYQDRLAGLSWRRLHAQSGTMPFIAELQKQLEAHTRPHYVLIDARTGLSDIGGLSTNRMANMVVLVFNLTRGCIEGSADACKSFLHRDSRPAVVQLVACPVPPSAGGKKDRVEEQLEFAAKEMSEAMRYGRRTVRIDYDPAMALAEELAVTDRGRYPAAQRYDELREIIQRANPREVWGVLDDARELRKNGRVNEAIEQLRAFADGTKDNAEGWLELGRFLLESGRSQESIDAFRKSCGVAPRFSVPHHCLGEALLAADQAREAVAELQEAERLGGVSQDLLGLLAAAYAETGDTERHAEARRRYAAELFGSLKSSGTPGEPDPSRLHQEFVEVLGLRPPYPGFEAEAFWKLLMGSPYGSIADKAKVARALLEGNLSSKQILGFQRDLKEEQKQFAEILGPESVMLHQLIAEGLLDPRDEDSLKEALRGDPSDALILRWVATLTSDPDEKIEYLRKALAIVPDDRRVLNDLLRSLASRASTGDADRWTRAAVLLIQQFNWVDTADSEIEIETSAAMGRFVELAPSKDLLCALAGACIERCAKAAEIKPGSHEAFHNWGLTLFYLAKASEGQGLKELYQEAANKYALALEIKPDFHEALFNWGNALIYLAKASEGKTQKDLYRGAANKYALVLEIKPGYHEALNNWGSALANWAKVSEGETQKELHRKAANKYALALEIKPDNHEALYNWGNTLADLAKASEGEIQKELYQEAANKYALAFEIKPDYHEALNNWALASFDLAKASEGEAQRQYLLEARDLCSRANAIQPHAGDYNLACANSLLGEYGSAADHLVHELLRDRGLIGHALSDSDLNPVWSAFPDLRAALEACRTAESLAPLKEWLERRETG